MGKLRKIVLAALAVTLAGFLAVAVSPVKGYAARADVQETGALTLPPPDVQPLTVFDPNYKYLEKGGSYISDLGNQKINIWGETFATVHVDEIGIQLTLERWTGTAWVAVYYGSTTAETDSAYAYQSYIISSVQKGYYYRAKSLHWIKKGDTYEGGTRYSSSILIPL